MKIDINQFDIIDIKNKANINNQAEKDKGGEIKQVSREFESMFIFEMLKEMRKTIPENSLFENGLGKDVFTTIFDMNIADMASNNGGIGLAKIIEDYLMRNK